MTADDRERLAVSDSQIFEHGVWSCGSEKKNESINDTQGTEMRLNRGGK